MESIHFENFTEFVNAAAAVQRTQAPLAWRIRDGYNTEWAGTRTFGEAVRLARAGWPEGWQRMQALRDATFARLAARVQRDRVEFRVAGGNVCVGRYLTGRPDCFMRRVATDQLRQAPSRKVLRMVINVGARGNVSPDVMFTRGAACVTLFESLERAGFRVEATMLSLALAEGKEGKISVLVKRPDEPTQLDKFAFCFAHAALHRRLNFAIREAHLFRAGVVGGSIDVPHGERGDI